ncbi:MAG: hypothetical protein K0R25_424 [Rickettsiaceae bacterium]|jgi:hypothetical protein|nr:hypothetical protein [Rickettsiaceae bacterium]
MKKFLFFILIFYSTNALARTAWVDNKASCEKTKGIWKLFGNSCADNCDSKFDISYCISVSTYHCECGTSKCWDGNQCISNEIAKLDWEERTKELKKKRLAELKELEEKMAKYKADMEARNIAIANTQAVPGNPNATIPPVVTAAPTPPAPVSTSAPTSNPGVASPTPPQTPPLNSTDKIADEKTKIQKDLCQKQSGTWQEFKNGCVDSCSSKISKSAICTMAVTWGCKCSQNKCWDEAQNSCIEIEKYKQYNLSTKPVN